MTAVMKAYILISSPEFANRLEKTYSNDLSNSGTRDRQISLSWGTSQLDFTYGMNRIGKTKKRTNRDWLGGWVKQTGWVGGAPALPLGGRVPAFQKFFRWGRAPTGTSNLPKLVFRESWQKSWFSKLSG